MIDKMGIRGSTPAIKNFLSEKSSLLATVGAVIIWSASFVATKVAFRTFPPLTLGALRFILAGILLGILISCRGGFVWPKRSDLIWMIISGVLGITVYFAIENLGVSLATAADASLIVSAYPAITMLLEVILYRVRVTGVRFLGVGLAIAGVYWIVRESSTIGGTHRLIGDVILAATGIVWSFYNFITRKVVNKYPTIQITFYQTVAGAIAFIPLTLFERGRWRMPSPDSILALMYLGIFCSIIAFLLYAYGLKRLSSGSAVSLMNLVPVCGVFFSMLFLHETLSPFQIFGGIVVIAGIFLSVGRVRQTEPD